MEFNLYINENNIISNFFLALGNNKWLFSNGSISEVM